METIHKSGRAASPARALTLLASFGYAFEGIRYLITTQRNAKIHVAIGMVAVIAGVMLQISRLEWLALVVMIALVLTLEGVNTAVEALVDLTCPHYHPLAKVAKDVGAGMVLLAAIASVVVGVIIFWPRVWPLLLGWF